MHSQTWISRVRQGSTGPVDADRDATDQIARADQESGPEESITGEIVSRRVYPRPRYILHFGGEDNAHDDAVDGHDFTENDGDQVLGPDSWCLDTSSEDGRACNEDAPIRIQSQLLFSTSVLHLAHLPAFSITRDFPHPSRSGVLLTMLLPPQTVLCRGRCRSRPRRRVIWIRERRRR